MTRRLRPVALLVLASALPNAAAAESQLQLGYYVLGDTECGRASTVDIALVHWSGINAARSVCDFTSVLPALGGGETYDFVQSCQEIGTDGVITVSGQIVIDSDTHFELLTDGTSYGYRYCPQERLPEPWRSVDISDIRH